MREFFGDLKTVEYVLAPVKKILLTAIFSACFLSLSFFLDNGFIDGISITMIPLLSFLGPALCINMFSSKDYMVALSLPIKGKNIAHMIFFLFELLCAIIFLVSIPFAIVSAKWLLFLSLTLNILFCLGIGYISISQNTFFVLSESALFSYKRNVLTIILYLLFVVVSAVEYIAFKELDKEYWFVIIILIFIALFLPFLIFLRQKMLKKTLIKMRGTKNGF